MDAPSPLPGGNSYCFQRGGRWWQHTQRLHETSTELPWKAFAVAMGVFVTVLLPYAGGFIPQARVMELRET